MTDNDSKQISIAAGTNPSTEAGSIGGMEAYFDGDGRVVALLSIAPRDSTSVRRELHEGDTFELGPELWQVTKIDDPNTDYWTAVLTQLR